MTKKQTGFYYRAALLEYSAKSHQYSENDKEKWKLASFTSVNLSSLMTDLRPSKILELGVGTGRYFPYLNGTHYLGVDISPEMLSYAKDRKSILVERGFTDIHFVENELSDFLKDVPANSYDFVFSIGCIGYHVAVTCELLKNINRIMSRGAHLFLQTTQQSWKFKFKGSVKHWKNILLGRDDNSHFFISTTRHQLKNTSRQAGLDLLWVREDQKIWYDRPLLLSLYKKS